MFFAFFIFLSLSLWVCEALRVASVEFSPVFHIPPAKDRARALAEMKANLAHLADLASPAIHSTDLLVFPEDALNGPAFPTRASIAPYLEEIPSAGADLQCVDPAVSHTILAAVACLAQEYGAIVVVNMGEKDGDKQYNTNVAVSSEGKLLAKYRKTHLYSESQFDPGDSGPVVFPAGPDNVLVGLLTCFDLTFHDVAHALKVAGAEVIAAPSWWVNIPPLMTGLSFFQAFAFSYNVNLVTSGCGLNWLCAAAGIYDYTGAALAVAPPNPGVEPSGTFLSASLVRPPRKPQQPLDPSLTVRSHRHDATRAFTESPTDSSASSGNHSFVVVPTINDGAFRPFSVLAQVNGFFCNVSGSLSVPATPDGIHVAVVAVFGYATDLGFGNWPVKYCGLVTCPMRGQCLGPVLGASVQVQDLVLYGSFNTNHRVEKPNDGGGEYHRRQEASYRNQDGWMMYPLLMGDQGVGLSIPWTCGLIDLQQGGLVCDNPPAPILTLALIAIGKPE